MIENKIAVGWIRGGIVSGSPETPTEYDWDVERGAVCPSGTGWKPIYSQEELDRLAGPLPMSLRARP